MNKNGVIHLQISTPPVRLQCEPEQLSLIDGRQFKVFLSLGGTSCTTCLDERELPGTRTSSGHDGTCISRMVSSFKRN